MTTIAAAKILIVEDDAAMRRALTAILRKDGHAVDAAETGEDAVARLAAEKYDLVITDLKLPGIGGLDVLRAVKERGAGANSIMITAYASVESAVKAMQAGADDYLPKPFEIKEVRLVVKKVIDKRRLLAENHFLRDQLRNKYRFDNLIGVSEPMVDVWRLIEHVKDAKSTVLVLGETGAGKEMVARAIHANGVRAPQLFLPVNCGALNENLLESELFGHVRGAFTGAVRDQIGIFEAADGGTVFLDEIGDLSPALQQKLLRVLQDGEIQPVGSVARKKIDVRVIAATNRDLSQMVAQKTFREDLYYRVNIVSIRVPPLRERRDDIGPLAAHFLARYAAENNKSIDGLAPAALRALENYDWPGNVRELENAVERAVLFENGAQLGVDSLPPLIRRASRAERASDTEPKTIDEVVREHMERTLELTGHNKAKTAELLGINRSSLWRMMNRRKLGK
jgi:DNA-binding NtrC family response regulator